MDLRFMRRFALLAAAVLLCAGCLASNDDDSPVVTAPVDPLPDGDGHDHTDAAQHNMSTANMNFIDWETLGENGGAEIQIWGDYAYVASWSEVHIVDISDPHNIEVVGVYYDQEAQVKDVKIFGDGDWLLCNNEVSDVAVDPGAPAPPNDPQPLGAFLLDVRDKSNPTYASGWKSDERPMLGPHNVFVHEINQEWYAFLAHSDRNDAGIDYGAVVILHVSFPTASTPVMVEIGDYKVDPADTKGGWIFIHDMVVQTFPDPDHPVHGGKTYLYGAYWDAGVRIVDVSNPPAPTDVEYLTQSWHPPEVGSFYDELVITDGLRNGNRSNIHYTEPMPDMVQFDDGTWHHITVAAPEVIASDGGTGVYWILDTTYHDDIEVLGTFEIALDRGFEGDQDNWLRFSPHNFDTANGRIYASNYHAGIWVIDISDEDHLRNPEAVGWFIPAGPQDAEDQAGLVFNIKVHSFPLLWAVEYDRGYMYASDVASGMYVVQLDDDVQYDDRI